MTLGRSIAGQILTAFLITVLPTAALSEALAPEPAPWGAKAYYAGLAAGSIGTYPYYALKSKGLNSVDVISAVITPTFGMGQVVQGRFFEHGWIFLIASPLALMIAHPAKSSSGAVDQGQEGNAWFRPILLVAVWVLELIDLWRNFDSVDRHHAGFGLMPSFNSGILSLNLSSRF